MAENTQAHGTCRQDCFEKKLSEFFICIYSESFCGKQSQPHAVIYIYSFFSSQANDVYAQTLNIFPSLYWRKGLNSINGLISQLFAARKIVWHIYSNVHAAKMHFDLCQWIASLETLGVSSLLSFSQHEFPHKLQWAPNVCFGVHLRHFCAVLCAHYRPRQRCQSVRFSISRNKY